MDADGELGARIARLREERGMSQQNLADSAGINRAQIQAMESGRTANPGIQTLIPLARALAVTLDELAGMSGDPPGPDLIAALKLLVERTEALGRQPYDDFTPAEFAQWSLGTSLTYMECGAVVAYLNAHAIAAPVGASASGEAGHFVVGAVAGAMLERWRR